MTTLTVENDYCDRDRLCQNYEPRGNKNMKRSEEETIRTTLAISLARAQGHESHALCQYKYKKLQDELESLKAQIPTDRIPLEIAVPQHMEASSLFATFYSKLACLETLLSGRASLLDSHERVVGETLKVLEEMVSRGEAESATHSVQIFLRSVFLMNRDDRSQASVQQIRAIAKHQLLPIIKNLTRCLLSSQNDLTASKKWKISEILSGLVKNLFACESGGASDILIFVIALLNEATDSQRPVIHDDTIFLLRILKSVAASDCWNEGSKLDFGWIEELRVFQEKLIKSSVQPKPGQSLVLHQLDLIQGRITEKVLKSLP